MDNLVSGYSVTDWSSGKSKYIMKCSSSWEALEFVSKSGKLKKSVFLNMFRSVTVGRRPGGHSTLIGKARSDCAFYLECTNNNKTKKKVAISCMSISKHRHLRLVARSSKL